ncbi:hypothetical protein ACHAXR_013578 [Thalassiosira sp. AJA248-18]
MTTKSDLESRQDDDNIDKVHLAVDTFISTLQASLDDGSFESFSLKGPSAPRRRRKKNANSSIADDDALLEQQKEKLRGKYKTISGRLVLLQEKKKKKTSRGKTKMPANESGDASGTLYVQATIKYHLATDVAKNWKAIKQSNNSEQTEVEEGLRQLFSTAMGDTVDGEDSIAPLSEWGAENINGEELGILAGELVTSDGVYQLQLQPHHKASFRLSKKKKKKSSSQENKGASQQENDLSHLSHDRSKNVPLSPSSQFFQALGVSNADGKPVNGMASKLRQCQKYVEIVGNIVDNASSTSSESSLSRIRVIDMGCGRGYLTFSLHSYLSDKFAAMQDILVETQGIDRRPKLIEEINGITHDLGGKFTTLNFIEGTIGETNSLFGDNDVHQNAENANSLDILIALHACDTATDDAIWFAVGRGADIIVTAPCCQHELRPQIDQHTTNNPNHPLREVLRHAIYRERSTEQITDAMRAILLEIAGYTSQVFEFIGGEHTAKNVMITATKVKKTRRSEKEQEEWLQDRRRQLVDLAQLYGVKRQRLATLMGESIAMGEGDGSKTVTRNLSGMAPLEL